VNSAPPSLGFRIGAREGPVRNVLRFHLVYSGPLSASGNKSKLEEASQIRAALSPQIKHLWDTHHSLQVLKMEGARPPQNVGMTVAMGPGGRASPRQMLNMGYVDLIPALLINDKPFVPLVRRSLDLNCEIDILFLRQQDPGELISQGGDIDNRIKTLLDALRLPDKDEDARAPTPVSKEGCIFTLMESDTLVSRLNIDTDRLLFPQTEKPNEVHLVIEITLNVLRVGPHNMCLV
jgi:hypothetical protein